MNIIETNIINIQADNDKKLLICNTVVCNEITLALSEKSKIEDIIEISTDEANNLINEENIKAKLENEENDRKLFEELSKNSNN